MTAADKTKLDAIGSAATTTTTVGTANAAGTSTNFAREDHVHYHGLQTDGTLHAAVTTSVNGFMSAADKTKLNALGAPAASVTTVGSANVVGTSSNLAREDHAHAHGVHTDGTLHAAATGAANGFMTAADKTKLDAMGALGGFGTTINAVGAASSAGTSVNLAREDHVHAHGNQGGDTLHAAVTTGANGFMIAADKAKLDSMPWITMTPQAPKTTTTTMTGAGTQYYVLGINVPANALQAGSILRVTAVGSVSTTPSQLTVRVHYGPNGTTADTVVASTAMTTGSGTTAGVAEMVTNIIIRTAGTSGSAYVVTRGNSSGSTPLGTSGNSVIAATGTINTTTAGVLGVSWASSVSGNWTIQAAFAEVREQ